MDDYFARIRDFPHDVSQVSPPAVSPGSAAVFSSRLISLLQKDASPDALDTALQVVTSIPPQQEWGEYALRWAANDDDADEGREMIIHHVVQALSQGVFPPGPWFEALVTVSSPRARLKDVLSRWGQIDFKHVLDACAAHFHRPSLRAPLVQLLIEILLDTPFDPTGTSASPFMAQLAEHQFLHLLLQSLTFDTANYLFSLSLRLLLEVIPYSPMAITAKVPQLAIILGRVICWRDRPFVDEGEAADGGGYTSTPAPHASMEWVVAQSADEPKINPPAILTPQIITQSYLVFLYGAWPSNTIAFIREPVAYIHGKGVAPLYAVEWSQVWAPGVLATRVEPLIREFRLHPSLVVFTSSAELADSRRWDKTDPSEFIARSRALANADQPGSQVISLMEEDEVVPSSINVPLDVGHLERENELLRIEAKFTSRVRKQYLHHIGRLHKSSLRLNNDEAEIHSFVNRLKEQEKSIQELTKLLSQAREESSQAQQRHTKWASQQHDKVTSFRAEKATWQTEAAKIRGDLSEARAVVKSQQEELAVVKNERFKLQNQLIEAEPKIRRISDYEIRVKQLTESQRIWDSDLKRCKEAEEEAEAARAKCFQLEQLLRASRDESSTQARQISQLERDLVKAETLKPLALPPPLPPSTMSESDSTPGVDTYITLLEEARVRTEKVDAENARLRAELEQLQLSVSGKEDIQGDRLFIWGGAVAV